MNDPNRLLKWILLIALVVVSLLLLYPPERRLKGGIDLVGGTSLLYEIDTTGIADSDLQQLSTKVMGILRERVDPKSQMNLEWRPVGSTRLEVRMPQPPAIAKERRAEYNKALEKIEARNIARFEVEAALNLPEQERAAAFQALVRNVPQRTALLEQVQTKFKEKVAAQTRGDTAAADAAVVAYEAAMTELVHTSLPVNRLTDVLALTDAKVRESELKRLRDEYPAYDTDKAVTEVVKRYEEWAENKGSLEDPSDLKRLLRGAGVLEFRILAERDASSPGNLEGSNPTQPVDKYTQQLAKFGPRLKAGDRYQWLAVTDILSFLDKKTIDEVKEVKSRPGIPIVEEYAGRWYVLVHNDPDYCMLKSSAGKKWSLVRAYPDRNPLTGQLVVSFQLDPRGGAQFRKLTGSHVGRQLAISLDDTIASFANIREEIGEHCQISGNMTQEKVQDYVRILDAGSLPARLKDTPVAEKTIGPSLGLSNRESGIKASIWGFAIVIVIMVLYYGVAGGGMADIALTLNLLFTLAIMSLMEATFTLPGIAGLLLSIGMSIDANVLIFERIREERERGVAFKKALNAGYDKAFSAIFDGNLTAFITCLILGFVGSEEVRGFAYTLGIGIGCSMFTALTVTRLVFNTLAANGVLTDFRMSNWIKCPKLDWVGLRRITWPASAAATVLGLGAFVWMTVARTNVLYDIEFLGGTSVQIDLKKGVVMDDEKARERVNDMAAVPPSAAQWLVEAAEELGKAKVEDADTAGHYRLSSNKLTGDQIGALMRSALQGKLERDGITAVEHSATFEGKLGELSLSQFKDAVAVAGEQARLASERMRNARVQSVGEIDKETKAARSYEVMSTETNRDMVQASIVAAFGDKLQIQRSIPFQAVRDDVMTKEPWFIVEADDHYLSDVIADSANFDVRKFRGGALVQVQLDPTTQPITVDEFTKRVREVGLQPEFEQHRQRTFEVFPLGKSVQGDGGAAFSKFAVAVLDDSLTYDTDPTLWNDSLAKPSLDQIVAALEREKSLSQVIQFDKTVAGQSKNQAIYAGILSMLAIGAYVWFRFGTKDFGLAVLVCIVHDVGVVLGLLALSHYIHDTFLGRLLMIDDFKFDLTILAAVLTIVGYTMNDTIVVFDRIRENRGKLGNISARLINDSIDQTMSRNIMLASLVGITVATLYIFGGPGIHGFAFTMLMGTLVNTYSTVFVAVPLVHRPQMLRTLTVILSAAIAIGLIMLVTDAMAIRAILAIATLVICGLAWNRFAKTPNYAGQRQMAGSK